MKHDLELHAATQQSAWGVCVGTAGLTSAAGVQPVRFHVISKLFLETLRCVFLRRSSKFLKLKSRYLDRLDQRVE